MGTVVGTGMRRRSKEHDGATVVVMFGALVGKYRLLVVAAGSVVFAWSVGGGEIKLHVLDEVASGMWLNGAKRCLPPGWTTKGSEGRSRGVRI